MDGGAASSEAGTRTRKPCVDGDDTSVSKSGLQRGPSTRPLDGVNWETSCRQRLRGLFHDCISKPDAGAEATSAPESSSLLGVPAQ